MNGHLYIAPFFALFILASNTLLSVLQKKRTNLDMGTMNCAEAHRAGLTGHVDLTVGEVGFSEPFASLRT
jgi:hypothetical protein